MSFDPFVILMVNGPDVEISFEASECGLHFSYGVVNLPKLLIVDLLVICSQKVNSLVFVLFFFLWLDRP